MPHLHANYHCHDPAVYLRGTRAWCIVITMMRTYRYSPLGSRAFLSRVRTVARSAQDCRSKYVSHALSYGGGRSCCSVALNGVPRYLKAHDQPEGGKTTALLVDILLVVMPSNGSDSHMDYRTELSLYQVIFLSPNLKT